MNLLAGDGSVGQRLDEILELRGLPELVSAYFSPRVGNPFASDLFDTVGENNPNRFGEGDLLALNLLDERVGAEAVRRLLSGEADEYLKDVGDDADLWEATPLQLDKVRALRQVLRGIPSIGPTKSAKLCARKRPRMIPIYDSVVERVMNLNGSAWMPALRESLRAPSRRDGFIELLDGVPNCNPSLLRVVDVSIWMVGSNSRAAKVARSTAGLSASPSDYLREWRLTSP